MKTSGAREMCFTAAIFLFYIIPFSASAYVQQIPSYNEEGQEATIEGYPYEMNYIQMRIVYAGGIGILMVILGCASCVWFVLNLLRRPSHSPRASAFTAAPACAAVGTATQERPLAKSLPPSPRS